MSIYTHSTSADSPETHNITNGDKMNDLEQAFKSYMVSSFRGLDLKYKNSEIIYDDYIHVSTSGFKVKQNTNTLTEEEYLACKKAYESMRK